MVTITSEGFTLRGASFFANSPLQRHGVLLNPGQRVLSVEAFVKFVNDGCKDPSKYQMGGGFQAVLKVDINERLAQLYEAQRPFVQPRSPDGANRKPWTEDEMKGYAERANEIKHLELERIRIQKFFDSLDAER